MTTRDITDLTPTFTVSVNSTVLLSGSETYKKILTFYGGGIDGGIIKLYQNGTLIATETITDGKWTYTTTELPDGKYNYMAMVTYLEDIKHPHMELIQASATDDANTYTATKFVKVNPL